MNLIDLFIAAELIKFYNAKKAQSNEVLLGQVLFPYAKQEDLSLEFIKGASSNRVQLAAANYDADPVIRDRAKIEKLKDELPFFREMITLKESDRMKLLTAVQAGDEATKKIILERIFKEVAGLEGLIGSAVTTAEIMAWQLLASGTIGIGDGRIAHNYDYLLDDAQKESLTSGAKWDAPTTATPIADIERWADAEEDRTGERPEVCTMNKATFNLAKACDEVKNKLIELKRPVTKANIIALIAEETQVKVIVYNKKYKNGEGNLVTYLADKKVVFHPKQVGETKFGPTPEEVDSRHNLVSDAETFAMAEEGIGVLTRATNKTPKTVEFVVSASMLQSGENLDKVFIATVA